MAGSVLKRTCFYDVAGGTIRPHEWSLINYSGFGRMVEIGRWPFETNGVTVGQPKSNDNFADEFQKVDDFLQADDITLLKALNNGDITTVCMHGGRHFPRTGR